MFKRTAGVEKDNIAKQPPSLNSPHNFTVSCYIGYLQYTVFHIVLCLLFNELNIDNHSWTSFDWREIKWEFVSTAILFITKRQQTYRWTVCQKFSSSSSSWKVNMRGRFSWLSLKLLHSIKSPELSRSCSGYVSRVRSVMLLCRI